MDQRALTSIARWLAAGLVAAGCTSRRATQESPSPPDQPSIVVRGDLQLSATSEISKASETPPSLHVGVTVRNTADTTVTIESAASNCSPPIELVSIDGSRHWRWSQSAWRAAREPSLPAPLHGPVCVGEGLMLRVEPGHIMELGRQIYPLAAIMGDSIPAGRYRIRVAASIDVFVAGYIRDDTVHVTSGPVRLP